MRKKNFASGFVAGLVASALTASLVGCNTNASPAFVAAADVFVNTTVGPDYETYVQNDVTLNPAEVEDRLRNVRTFRAVVEAAKNDGGEN